MKSWKLFAEQFMHHGADANIAYMNFEQRGLKNFRMTAQNFKL